MTVEDSKPILGDVGVAVDKLIADALAVKLERAALCYQVSSLLIENENLRHALKEQALGKTLDAGWIPVSERLPEREGRYPVIFEPRHLPTSGRPRNKRMLADWENGAFFLGKGAPDSITYWLDFMLPPPPSRLQEQAKAMREIVERDPTVPV